MADPELAVHKALFARIGTLSTPVYDAVPQGTAYPYITIDTSVSDNADFLASRNDEMFVYLNIWSESRGQEEVKRIMGELNALLHELPLTLDTGTLISVRVERKLTRREADNVTFQGAMTLRLIVKH